MRRYFVKRSSEEKFLGKRKFPLAEFLSWIMIPPPIKKKENKNE
jgi:hypothetical protein